MELLIKQHAHFLGGILHQKKNSQNYLFHLLNLNQQFLFPGYSASIKSQQNQSFCWFFFCHTIHNKQDIK